MSQKNNLQPGVNPSLGKHFSIRTGPAHPEPKEEEGVCEHGDHEAPKGKRFCSDACERCEHESNSDTGCDNICGLGEIPETTREEAGNAVRVAARAVCDAATLGDCKSELSQQLGTTISKVPSKLIAALERAIQGEEAETPKGYRLRELAEDILRSAINIAEEKDPKWYKNSNEKIVAILALKDQWDSAAAAICTPSKKEGAA